MTNFICLTCIGCLLNPGLANPELVFFCGGAHICQNKTNTYILKVAQSPGHINTTNATQDATHKPTRPSGNGTRKKTRPSAMLFENGGFGGERV
eukprot:16432694-Heterocapsa_arctica.AAC.1